MDKVSILLVDNPYFNITKIDSALNDAGLDHTLYFAGNGKNALNILMGDPFDEVIASDTAKLKPQVVILSKELKDIPASEFLGIIGKYYSLRDIRIFLLSDSLTDAERFVYDELGVCGYLQRPLDKEQIVKEIQPHLNGGRTHFALMPVALWKLTKTKPVFIQSKLISMGLGTKIAACLVAALMICGIADHTADKHTKEDVTAPIVKMPEQVIEQALPANPLPLSEPASTMPVPQKKITSPKHEVTTANLPAPPKTDSIEASRQTNVSASSLNKLRIIAIEEPDSIAD